jgi:CRP/FNR family cyclic AMP-dependent transcriptional regulator
MAIQTDVPAIIRSSDWFKDIPEDAIQKLAKATKIEKYAKNSFLFCAGDITKSIYCLLEGRIRVSIVSSIGQEFALTDIEPLGWMGDASLFSEEGRVLELQFKEAGRALNIPRNVVLAIADEYPTVYKNLLKDHMIRTRQTYLLLGGMLFYPLKSRLAGRILSLLEEHGTPCEEGTRLNISLSQKDFARLILGSRQRINKIFREWDDLGIILMKDGRYIIPDITRLEKEVELQDE